MDKNMAMLNLSVQNKEGWSLKLCKSPLNGITVKLLTFDEGFFRLDMSCRFALRECRIDRQTERKEEEKRKKERKEKRCKENFQLLESSAKGL